MDPTRARMVSNFGIRRGRATGQPRMHAGIDVSTGRAGDPVFSVKNGTAVLVTTDANPRGMSGYGNAVVIRHDDGKYALYAHMSTTTVNEGQQVRVGQQVGTMGNTTNGQFSPLTGESRAAFEARARAAGRNPRVMVPHLHFEVRRAKPDGTSPFPGPYPQRLEDALYNLDPGAWLRGKGMTFTRRGGIQIAEGSAAARFAARTPATGMAGMLAVLGVDDEDLAAAGQYEPVEFERDVRFGLTDNEWIGVGVGAIAVVGLAVVLGLRSRRVATNTRRGPRSNRMRRWGQK